MTANVKLWEVATLYDSLHKTPNSYIDNGYPMIRVTDVKRGFVNFEGTKKVGRSIYNEFSKKYKPEVGDVIFTRVGSYGNSCYVNKSFEFCLGQNTVCISPKQDLIHPYFLYIFLNSPQAKTQIESFISGSSQPTISLKNIKEIALQLPLKDVQKSRSNAIAAYDTLIENNNRRIVILEKIAQSIYKEWFIHFRFPGHENCKFKDSLFGKIPYSWSVGRIKDIGSVHTGKTPSKKKANYYNSNVIPFLKTPDMHGAIFAVDISDYLSQDGADSQKNKFIPEGSICVSCIGARAGAVAITPFSLQTNQQINSVILNDTFWREYLYLFCISLHDKIHAIGSSGATMTNVSKGKFETIETLLPDEKILVMFSRFTKPLFDSILNLQLRNMNLKKQRDMLLPKLISGEINV